MRRTSGLPRKPRKLPAWCFVRLVREPEAGPFEGTRIRSPNDLAALLQARGAHLAEVESFYVICLDSQSAVRAVSEVTRGILNSSLVHPREVFRVAIVAGAAGIIVAHNHPSGDPTPSADDRSITRQIVDAGRLLDIPCYDHVILGGERYVSFAEAGLL